MRYDDFLQTAGGGFGRYQIIVFVLLSFIGIKAGLERQLIVYFVYAPSFACVAPWNRSELNGTCEVSDGRNATRCTQWSYDRSVLRSTMVTEFDLVCDLAFYADLLMTLNFLGGLCGALTAFTADKFGRRKVIICSVIFEMVTNFLLVIAKDLKLVSIIWFLRGMGIANYIQGFTYLTEIVSSRNCALVGTIYWVTLSIGYASAGAVGKLLQDWRVMQLTSSCIGLVYLSYFFFVWESPRWLLAVGRKREAIAVLRRISRVNGTAKKVTDEQLQSLRVESGKGGGRFLDIFASPQMRKKTMFSWILNWIASEGYYGVVLDSSFSSSDIFLNTVFMGAIEMPSYIASAIIGHKLGRRWPSIFLTFLTSVVIFSVPHFPEGSSFMWLKTLVAIIGKFGVTSSYTIYFLWAAELQPVSVRSVGFFSSVLCHYFGSIASPYVLRLREVRFWLPSVVFGCQYFIGGIMMLFLPETRGVPLQQTIEEADLLVAGHEKDFGRRLSVLHDAKQGDRQPLALESKA